MFADVPTIVYEETVGGAPSRINQMTGILSSDRELAKNICYMLDHAEQFGPRKWALQHTGSKVATRILDETIERTVVGAGEKYRTAIVEKTNAPNLNYKDPSVRAGFEADFRFIRACRRSDVPGVPSDSLSPVVEKTLDDM
jgi:hypothetical protein